jgi:hypothetical protein
MDVRPLLVTTYFGGTIPYAIFNTTGSPGSADATFSTCPLFNMVNSSQWATLKLMYTEYRIKKITLHIMLSYINCSPVATNNIGIGTADPVASSTAIAYTNTITVTVMSGAWIRNG